MKRWIILVVILTIAGISGAGYLGYRSSLPKTLPLLVAPPTTPVTTCTVDQTATAPGILNNSNEIKIVMPVTGHLADVLVQPGDVVKKGQVLARLADKQKFEVAIAADQLALLEVQQERTALDQNAPLNFAKAQAAVQEAQIALQKARDNRNNLNYPRADAITIDRLKSELALAEDALAQAQKYYDSLANLPPDDPQRASALTGLDNARQAEQTAQMTLNWYLASPSQSEIADADAKLALAKANLTQAQADYEKIKNGPDPLAVALADAKVTDAQANLAADQAALANLEINAPSDGVILKVSASAGDSVSDGTELFILHNPAAVEVKATVTEEDYPYINVGQPVSLFFNALPDEAITGIVTRIVPLSNGGDNPVYDIYISLDHVPSKLVQGMSAVASISLAQRKDVLCLPRAVVQATNSGTAIVHIWVNGQEVERTIKVGLRGDTSVEILSGLNKGDLVVTQ
jgi:HlyD family secretion protein